MSGAWSPQASLRFAAEMRAGAGNVKSGSKGTGIWGLDFDIHNAALEYRIAECKHEYSTVEVLYSAHLAGISYGPCELRAE